MGTVVVTGSASGIGAATRAALEELGHHVIGVDQRDAEVLADLSSAQERARALGDVIERIDGTLDGLVTCAGVGPPFDPAGMLAINWLGTEVFLSGLRAALAASNGIAKVVAVSSNATSVTPNVPDELVEACLSLDEGRARSVLETMDPQWAMALAYAASKTAVARYVRRHAPSDDWAGSGIRLNSIAPGAVLTPLLQGGLDDEVVGAAIRMLPVPTGDFAEPGLIAQWITMMLSPAADFLCGSVLFVDGGSDAMIRTDDWPRTFEL